MELNRKGRAGWYAAFIVLFNEWKPEGGFTAGSIVLTLAVLTTPVFGFTYFSYKETLSGAIPPDVPIINATGHFINIGRGKNHDFEFVVDDQKKYFVSRICMFPGASSLVASTSPTKIQVEGFILQNGKGSFWFSSVKRIDGQVLLTPEQSMQQLAEKRDARDLIIFYSTIAGFLWTLSIFNIYRIKRELSRRI